MARPADPDALARVLTGQRARRLERQAAEACVPPGALSRLQPILQVTALAGLVARADGLYPEFGVDETLAVSARNSNKPIVALESAASQLKVLAGESEAEEGAQIDAALDELESGKLRGQLKELADVWARSDAAKLGRYADWCGCLDTPAEQRLMKRLLDDRNPNLADGIERLHAGGKGVFAAVGALHMIGAQGLPTLMAARGFTVTPVLTDAQAQTAVPMPALAAPSPAPRAVRGGKAVKGQRGQNTSKSAAANPRAARPPRRRRPRPPARRRRRPPPRPPPLSPRAKCADNRNRHAPAAPPHPLPRPRRPLGAAVVRAVAGRGGGFSAGASAGDGAGVLQRRLHQGGGPHRRRRAGNGRLPHGLPAVRADRRTAPGPGGSRLRCSLAAGPRGPVDSRRAPGRGHRRALAGPRAPDFLLTLSKPLLHAHDRRVRAACSA
jgi:hypothetical protein